jgi:hypothetical protein
MRQHPRSDGVRFTLVAAAALGATMLTGYAVGHMHTSENVERMSKQTKTVCVGRFLLDVPVDAQVSIGSATIDGLDITHYGNETAEQFDHRTARRTAEINADETAASRTSMESEQEIRQDTVRGKIFVFNRQASYYLSNGEKMPTLSVSIDGYANVYGMSLRFSAVTYKPEAIPDVARLLAHLQPLEQGSLPKQPGFCLDGAFLLDPLTAERGEHIVMFAGMPGHEDLGVGMATMAGHTPGPGLIERSTASRTGSYAFLNSRLSALRKGQRTIHGIPGEEFVFKSRENNGTTGYAFNWETQGTESDVLRPFVSLELQAGMSLRAGGAPVQATLPEAALFDLWQSMTSSLRVRPVAPATRSEVNNTRYQVAAPDARLLSGRDVK